MHLQDITFYMNKGISVSYRPNHDVGAEIGDGGALERP